ncbi:MAG: DUF3800 domain-containing protein [Culicoidibacterales bacterium]
MIYGYFQSKHQHKRLTMSLENNCDACLLTTQIWRILQAGDTVVCEDIFQLIHQIEEIPSLLLQFYHQKIDFFCLNQSWLTVKQTTPIYLINDIITGVNRLNHYRPQKKRQYRLVRKSIVKHTQVHANFHYQFILERLTPTYNRYAMMAPVLAENEITICLDESGSLGIDQNRFFVLGGFITNRLHRIINRYSKLEEQEKFTKRHKRQQELKSTHLAKNVRYRFIETLLRDDLITPVCLLVDKADPKFNVAKKREYYNFLVKTLIQKICECQMIEPHAHINLRIDQQSLPIESVNSLVEYLNAELRYDEKERCNIQQISVEYLDSAKHIDIRIADLIVGVVRVNAEHEQREIHSPRLNHRLIHFYL